MWGCYYGEGAAEGGFDVGVEVVADRGKTGVSEGWSFWEISSEKKNL